jgi:hypothetical protein
MHPVARQVEVMARVATVEREGLRRLVDHVLDQRAGEAQASVIAEDRARPGHASTPLCGRLRQPHHLQRVEHGGMDARDLGLGQGLVLPAAQARTHRALVLGQRGGAQGDARRPPAAAAAFLRFDFGRHIRTLSDFGS